MKPDVLLLGEVWHEKTRIIAIVEDNRDWLLPYAEFMAKKQANGGRAWNEWKETDDTAGTAFSLLAYSRTSSVRNEEDFQ